MGGKKDAGKKAPAAGGYKAGKALKDILPPNAKAPREGNIARLEGEPDVQRTYEFEPLQMLPEWPGNEEAKVKDFTEGFEQAEDGTWSKFTEEHDYQFPPSFADHFKGEPQWKRPEEYVREIMYEAEVQRRRKERKREYKLMKAARKGAMMSLSSNMSVKDEDDLAKAELELEQLENARKAVRKDELVVEPKVIVYEERLETEAEIQRRKEKAAEAAAADKAAKKKAPPKGKGAVEDPEDEPQMIQIPVDGSLDMSFPMPAYTKWVTSQMQFIRDRTIRDVDSLETIWQRIYPQENGIPRVSPTGKYWVKLRFMGKERLVEIDDTMPCAASGLPIFPRTCEPGEIWPQLLMKAIMKVYSYKWYASAQYDAEIGDGSIVYSLTGLIPEHVPVGSAEEARDLFRAHLGDEAYFGKKAYLTAYCQNDFRPKFPSQVGQMMPSPLKIPGRGPGSVASNFQDDATESALSAPMSSSALMLSKLKEAASLAISVTTGRKPVYGAKERNLTNIIPGFGYALMDVFENEFVNMDSISKRGTTIVEENASPFASPHKSAKKRDKSMSKDEYRKFRREQRLKQIEDFEAREQQAPEQFALVKIKTSIGKHPVINYLSPFTNDEVVEAKKHLINHWRRDPSKPTVRALSPSKKPGQPQFKIDLTEAKDEDPTAEKQDDAVPADDKSTKAANEVLLPKTRGAGGIWLAQDDFPCAFQHIIVYHNVNKYSHCELHQDIWENAAEPYLANEKEIYVKLELDQEAVDSLKAAQQEARMIGVQPTRKPAEEGDAAEESKDPTTPTEAGNFQAHKTSDTHSLPGELTHPVPLLDKILIGYAPYPTNKPHGTLPRYQTRFRQVDCEIEGAAEKDLPLVERNFQSYFEGATFTIAEDMSAGQNCIWLKPDFNCPQGASVWVASQCRSVKIVSKNEYLAEQKGFIPKQVTFDYGPMQAGKYQMLAKYEFSGPEPTEEEPADKVTTVSLKVDTPADRFLMAYMRLKIVEKSADDPTETGKVTIVNAMALQELKIAPKAEYVLIVEGVFPYNTAEGQLVIETLSDNEAFELKDVQQCEPLEYSDAYVPTKYGIIFKEKLVVSPTDHTCTSMNVRLMKGEQEFSELSQTTDFKAKYFRVEVLDNGKVIHEQWGYNQITLTHFNFRCNAGLPDEPGEDGGEVKHNYVIQALFDLNEWPECKSENDESAGVAWQMKVYSSETVAIIKDTDKEDREAQLKASWEADEPGRAEKAKLSRQKFLIKQKSKRGEELTEDEQAILNERRARIRKRDQEADAPAAKGGKDKGKGAKGGKGAAAAEQVEEEVKEEIVYPAAADHVNAEIKAFLDHFAAARTIVVDAVQAQPRKRSEEEKTAMLELFEKEVEEQTADFNRIAEEREAAKATREESKATAFEDVETARTAYTEELKELVLAERNGYREKIDSRKEKETAMVELIKQDKEKDTMPRPDVKALQAAIEAAEEVQVKPKYVTKAKKYLELIEYILEFESFLQQAVADKDKEGLTALIERADAESAAAGKQLPFDAKTLADAKGNLAKMK